MFIKVGGSGYPEIFGSDIGSGSGYPEISQEPSSLMLIDTDNIYRLFCLFTNWFSFKYSSDYFNYIFKTPKE